MFHSWVLCVRYPVGNLKKREGVTPLHDAVMQEDLEAARWQLIQGCDVNARDSYGYSALHLSAENGFKELVQLLLENGAMVDYRVDTAEDLPTTTEEVAKCEEPLHLALINRHLGVAKLLLEYGADPNKTFFFGSQILSNDLKYLLRLGAKVDTLDAPGMTPLMKAAELKQAVRLLIKHGADVNAVTYYKNKYQTVLHYGVLSGKKEMVSLLIKHGARINNVYPDMINARSPLDYAVMYGSTHNMRLLISEGAIVNVSRPGISSPLHFACTTDTYSNSRRNIQILLQSGADPNVKATNNTYRICPELDDFDEEVPVSALVMYLMSPTNLRSDIVSLLLKYGTRVVMKASMDDEDGILDYLENVVSTDYEHLFYLLLEAAESFDLHMITRSNVLTATQKQALIKRAKTPIPLKAQVRLFLRKKFGTALADDPMICIPKILRQYLNFEIGYEF